MPADRSYVFVRVLATVNDGLMNPVSDPVNEYPDRGTIFVPGLHLPHGFHYPDIGTWKVGISPQFPEHTKTKYMATAMASEVPAEILSVDCCASDSSAARALLLETGIPLAFRPANRPYLIRFGDNPVIGPFLLAPARAAGRFVVSNPQAFRVPVGAWESQRSLFAVSLRIGQADRTFVGRLSLPPAEMTVDLATPDEILTGLLKSACKTGPGKYLLTESQRALIVERLRTYHGEAITPERLERAEAMLGQDVLTAGRIETLVAGLLQRDDIRKAFEQERKEATEAARQDLVRQEANAQQRIQELEHRKQAVERELADLEGQRRAAEARAQQEADSVAESIAERVRQAQQGAAALLADVAVLRPFLQHGSVSTASPNSPNAPPASEEPQTMLTDFTQACEYLQTNLERVGLARVDATVLAQEIVAAVALGQWVVFGGSVADLVARTVARSLACRCLVRFPVRIGLTGEDAIERLLAEHSGTWSAVVFEGVNRSCWGAYGADVLRRVAERVLAGASPTPVILGTLAVGPSALPVDGTLVSHGPVFDMDALSWRPKPHGEPVRPGQVTSLPLPDVERLLDDTLGELIRSSRPHALWRQQVQAVFGVLRKCKRESAHPDALASVAYGWVVPRVTAEGEDLHRLATMLADLKDPRVWNLFRMHGVERPS